MMEPPPYPRIPLIEKSTGSWDDRVLAPAERLKFLSTPAIVEEKLDGANVVMYVDGTHIVCSGRSGRSGMDRGHQLGRLRAWAGRRDADLRQVLQGGVALYAEWLWVRHSVRYTSLPDYLVCLDVWHPARGFAPTRERDERVARAGIPTPPCLFMGIVGSIRYLEELVVRSAFGDEPAEGAVIRIEENGRFLRAKFLAHGFHRSEEIGRVHNELTRVRR
jgi:hypothetical protein